MTDPSRLLKNACQPEPGLLTGGQPDRECLEAVCAAGYRTVVNLRPVGEFDAFDEAHVVRELGLEYVHIPVADADGLNAEAVASLDAVLADAQQRPMLIHCGSGNRVGALIAMHASRKRGLDVDEALACGDAAGLTKLRDTVREKLQADKCNPDGLG